MDTSQLDNIFLGILQNCGQIEPFLDAVFCFLARRTDFFLIMDNKESKMGFPEGLAEKMVLKIFRKYHKLVLGNSKEKESKSAKVVNQTLEKHVSKQQPPKPTTEQDTLVSKEPSLELRTEDVPVATERVEEAQADISDVVASTVEVTSIENTQNNIEMTTEENKDTGEVDSHHPPPTTTTSACTSTASSSTTDSNLIEPGKELDCYNGAVLDNYTWSQTIKDIDVEIPVPKCVQRARDVNVEIKNTYLRVSLKGNIPLEELKSGSRVLIDGKLQRTVKCQDSMWSLEPGKCIQVNLEKTEERFWTAVCEGDPEIDKTKVDSTRNIEDFDEQTQTDFQQVMYDHQQKLMGQPTSKEQKTQDLLKQAWNAKGSPFAGTPFDTSKVNISG